MTIDASTKPRRPLPPVALMLVALVAIGLAGLTARGALAGSGSDRYLTSARSADLLRTTFGAVAERPIQEPRVVVAPTSAATWALSDDVNMANQAWNPRTARPWAIGDARAMWPGGMGGFTDPVTGAVYINAQTAERSHVPHELLHANASPDFLLAVGVAVNEGVTERLALDALAAARLEAEDAPAYAQERGLAAAIEKLTGRDLLLRAYFNGGADLAEFVAALGADTLAKVRNAAAANNIAGALAALPGSGR
jgi:hypothetical protein